METSFYKYYAPIFIRVLELCDVSGVEQRRVAEILTSEGWTTQRGGPIHQVTVCRILKAARKRNAKLSQNSVAIPISQLPPGLQEKVRRQIEEQAFAAAVDRAIREPEEHARIMGDQIRKAYPIREEKPTTLSWAFGD